VSGQAALHDQEADSPTGELGSKGVVSLQLGGYIVVPKSLFRVKGMVILGAGFVGAFLLHLSFAQVEQRAGIPSAPHGAASMNYQLQELGKLLFDADPTKVPAVFDPVIWDAFVPKDNLMTPEKVALGRKL
jgi:hypothetical protein